MAHFDALRSLASALAASAPQRAEAAPFASIAVVLTPLLESESLASRSSGPQRLPWQLLLIERAQREGDPWSGHMALPGGRIDPGDASPLAAAIRETLEETGVVVRPTDLIGELDDVHPRGPATGSIVRPFVFAVQAAPALTLSDEVASALWVPLDELTVCACTAAVDYRGTALSVPAYRCGPHIVWGMTHRVVSGLLELLDVKPATGR